MIARPTYIAPRVLWDRYKSDPIRVMMVCIGTYILSYGTREALSPLNFKILDPIMGGGGVGPTEGFFLLITLLELIRRMMARDFTIERSRLALSIVAVALVVCFVPFVRMVAVEGRFRFPIEMMYFPMMLFAFFVWMIMFRREELLIMVWMVLIAMGFKTFEGTLMYITGMTGNWGLLTAWRDAMLLTLAVLGGFFAFIIKPEGDPVYGRIRRYLLWLFPVALAVFMASLRRSYMISAVLVVIASLFIFGRTDRRRALVMFAIMVVIGTVAVLATGPASFLGRIAGIIEPTSEGSSAFRVIELYNYGMMVLDSPIIGWPMGSIVENRTLLEIPGLSWLMPHNIYLYVLYRSGVIGLIFYLWFVGAVLRMNYRAMRSARTPLERFLSFWLASTGVTLVVTGWSTAIATDYQQYLMSFLLVMASYLPGTWGRLRWFEASRHASSVPRPLPPLPGAQMP